MFVLEFEQLVATAISPDQFEPDENSVQNICKILKSKKINLNQAITLIFNKIIENINPHVMYFGLMLLKVVGDECDAKESIYTQKNLNILKTLKTNKHEKIRKIATQLIENRIIKLNNAEVNNIVNENYIQDLEFYKKKQKEKYKQFLKSELKSEGKYSDSEVDILLQDNCSPVDKNDNFQHQVDPDMDQFANIFAPQDQKEEYPYVSAGTSTSDKISNQKLIKNLQAVKLSRKNLEKDIKSVRMQKNVKYLQNMLKCDLKLNQCQGSTQGCTECENFNQ